jgi:molybdopterin/thiamine biosynthesis adenylyltransferase
VTNAQLPDVVAPDRFSRERLAGYDPAAVGGGTVLVAGAGALAQNLLINLALSGVGELRIVDFDAFEGHNAPRSPLFPTPAEQSALGMEKARVVAAKVHALMRATQPCVRFAVAPVQSLGAGAFEGVDVVAACVDNPEARAYLSDTCRLLGIGLVEGGFHGSQVSMSCFPPSAPGDAVCDPCYRCGNASVVGTFSCQRHAAATLQTGAIPAIQSAAATLGGLQAEAIIQALHGVHAGYRRLNLDIRNGATRGYELTLDPECQGFHRRFAAPIATLRCGGEDPLGTLIEEIEAALGGGGVIALRESLVCEAYCDGCAHLVRAGVPDWAWRANPRCVQCGGAFDRCARQADDLTPVILHELGADTPAHVRAVSCRQAGLPALAIVEARAAAHGAPASFRLAGRVDELFESPSAAADGADPGSAGA